MMMDREKQLEEALAEVCRAAAVQLSGMGKGRDPSERLREAFDKASELLGTDATTDPNDRHAAIAAENERLRAELAARGIKL